METLTDKITLNLDGDAEISVKAFIAPIAHTLSNFHVEWDALANLRVAEPEKQYPASVFQSFLPENSVSVGDCWQIEKSSVLELLRQLHPNPNLDLDRDINAEDSLGLWACLRAYNSSFADIAFRIHAEFKLEDGWFTPSQFTGNLTIDRSKEQVVFFKMFVPEGTVNFDVNWHEDKEVSYSITDAGFCSQMELRAGTEDIAEMTAVSITQEEAERALILRLYESEQINWMAPDQALAAAQTQQKPLHVISIDGPLADESC